MILLEQPGASGSDDLLDLAGEVRTYARQIGQVLALLHHLLETSRPITEGACRHPIGPHAERIGPFDLQQIGQLVKFCRHVGIRDGHSRISVSD